MIGDYTTDHCSRVQSYEFMKMSCHVYLANIALESCQLVCSVGSHTQSSVSGKQKTLSAEKSDQLLNPPSASNQPSDTRDLFWLFPKCQHNWGDPSGKLIFSEIIIVENIRGGNGPGLDIVLWTPSRGHYQGEKISYKNYFLFENVKGLFLYCFKMSLFLFSLTGSGYFY